MDTPSLRAGKNLEENYVSMKKNGKLCLLLFLAIIPSLCFTSVKLHVIKIGATDILRCEIEGLENTSWNHKEMKEISQYVDHGSCYIHDYDYHTLAPMTLKEANKYVKNKFSKTAKKKCPRFVANKNKENYSKEFSEEYLSYCESMEYDIVYDFAAILPYIFSCLLLVQFADLYGRKRILSIGCNMVYFSIFIKIIFLHYTREIVGEAVMNSAYPALKYTTEALIFEITSDTLRPFAFTLMFLGPYIPLLISELVSPTYWKYMSLIAWSPILLLPLLNWYFPESPLWLLSKNNSSLAEIFSKHVNDPGRNNHIVLILKNGKPVSKKQHYQEILKMDKREFILINIICVCVGTLSFHSYSMHKLLYQQYEEMWIKLLDVWSGSLALVFIILCVYSMDLVKVLIASLFFINGVLHLLSVLFYSSFIVQFSGYKLLLMSFINFAEKALLILYEFYLQQIFPTSHRCTFTAICGVSINIGLLTFIVIQELHHLASYITLCVASLLGCVLSVFVIRKLKRTNPPILKLNNEEIQENS